MAKFEIRFRQSVEKELKKTPQKDRIRILRKIAGLTTDPRPPGCKKLSGQERYRLRQENYRVLYEIMEEVLLVVIVKTGHRRAIYQ